MDNLIVLGIGVAIGYVMGWRQGRNGLTGDLQKVEEQKRKPAEEKAENKDKIRRYFDDHLEATNNDLENLLGVSDATATRYLEELEKEGLIRQVGSTGKAVKYIKK